MDQKGPVLGPFLARFSIRGTTRIFWGSVQTSKMVNFDPKYLKVQIPHCSENFRIGGGATIPPNCEIVSYDTISEMGGVPCPPHPKI